MTNEEAQIIIGNIPIKPEVLDDCYSIAEYQEAKAMAIKALEQQPSEDCISRSNLLKEIENGIKAGNYEEGYEEYSHVNNMDDIIECIKYADSVTPERPKGKWIEYEVDIVPHPLHCSICGFSNHHISNRYMKEFRRCPNCGAEMSGGREDDDNINH